MFIGVYNVLYDGITTFDSNKFPKSISKSVLEARADGSLHLLIGWFSVLVVSHLICWPLAWSIRRLPGFDKVL